MYLSRYLTGKPSAKDPEHLYLSVYSISIPVPSEIVPSIQAHGIPNLGFDLLSQPELRLSQQSDQVIAAVVPFIGRTSQEIRRSARQGLPAAATILLRQLSRLVIEDGIVFRRVTEPGYGKVLQVVVPSALRSEVLRLGHECNGHQGADRFLQLLRRRCFWPGMDGDVRSHCLECQRCQQGKLPATKVYQPTGHLLATSPLDIVAMDFTLMDMAADGTENVLVLTDVFSK